MYKTVFLIEFFILKGCAPIEIHGHLKAIYGDYCIDVTKEKKRACGFDVSEAAVKVR